MLSMVKFKGLNQNKPIIDKILQFKIILSNVVTFSEIGQDQLSSVRSIQDQEKISEKQAI